MFVNLRSQTSESTIDDFIVGEGVLSLYIIITRYMSSRSIWLIIGAVMAE